MRPAASAGFCAALCTNSTDPKDSLVSCSARNGFDLKIFPWCPPFQALVNSGFARLVALEAEPAGLPHGHRARLASVDDLAVDRLTICSET